ncbi:MAG: glycosyltransferase family 2 protein [Nitrososphaeria archaeon]|nr:glycosyltransferase family 2 protein [Nitrososphaeria archaeon]
MNTIDKRFNIIACIPAYNEEKSIAKVILQTKRYVNQVIVCDDGSTDMTAEIAENLGAIVLKHTKNMGKGAAIKTLLEYAKQLKPDIIVTLDADGQHDPNGIPKLLKPIIEEKAEFVIGSRYVPGSKTETPLYRRIGLKIVNWLSGRGKVKDTQSGYRAYPSKIVDLILQCESKGYGIEVEQLTLAIKNKLRIIEVPITIRYKNLENPSKRNPIRHGTELITIALRLIVEEKPLVFLGVPGILLIVIGLVSGVYLLLYFNMTRYFSIPIALITLGTLFTGILLVVTALILYSLTRLVKKYVSNYKN